MTNKKVEKSTHIINAIYYTLMPFVRSVLSFLILPVMTKYLTPDNYGVLTFITMLTTFSWMFYLGLNNACYRLYFKYKDDIHTLRKMLSTNILFIVTVSLFYCALIFTLFPFFNNYFFTGQLKVIWLILALLQFTLVYLNTINQDILRIQYEGRKWFFNEFSTTIIMIFLSIILVLTRKFTFEAIIIANLTAESVKYVITCLQLREYYGPVFSKTLLKESLIYSWPQTPSGIIGFLYSYFDKILLSKIKGLTQVGILDISNKFSLLLKTNMDGISGVFSPVSLELLTQNTQYSLKKLADICLKLIFLILFLSSIVILFSKELILLFTAKEYHFAIYVIPIYIHSQVFAVLGMVSYWLIYYHHHKTFWQIPLSAIGLASNSVANIFLIPKYGLIGAAIAMFVSCGLTQLVQFFVGLKITPIPINIFKLSLMFFMLFVETGVLYLLYYLKLNILSDIFIKLAMLLLFVLIGQIWGMFNFNDIKDLLIVFQKKIKKIKVF